MRSGVQWLATELADWLTSLVSTRAWAGAAAKRHASASAGVTQRRKGLPPISRLPTPLPAPWVRVSLACRNASVFQYRQRREDDHQPDRPQRRAPDVVSGGWTHPQCAQGVDRDRERIPLCKRLERGRHVLDRHEGRGDEGEREDDDEPELLR